MSNANIRYGGGRKTGPVLNSTVPSGSLLHPGWGRTFGGAMLLYTLLCLFLFSDLQVESPMYYP